MAVRIGELLLKEKRITPQQLQEALNAQKANGGKLGASLVKLGFVRDEDITALLSKQYGVPSINLTQFEIDPTIIKLIPSETAHKYQIVPLSRSGATLTIAMTDPTNVFAMDDIKFMTGYNVEPVVASETAVLEAIERYYMAPASRSGESLAPASPLEMADISTTLTSRMTGASPPCRSSDATSISSMSWRTSTSSSLICGRSSSALVAMSSELTPTPPELVAAALVAAPA